MNNFSSFKINPYNVLQVPQNATLEEIKAAKKKLARQHHPDKGGSEELMKIINTAFAILSDPINRSDYDNFKAEETNSDDVSDQPFPLPTREKSSRMLKVGHKLSDDYREKIKAWRKTGAPLSDQSSYQDIGKDNINRHRDSYNINQEDPSYLSYKNLLGSDVLSVNELLYSILPREVNEWVFISTNDKNSGNINIFQSHLFDTDIEMSDVSEVDRHLLYKPDFTFDDQNMINFACQPSAGWNYSSYIHKVTQDVEIIRQNFEPVKPDFFSSKVRYAPGMNVPVLHSTQKLLMELGHIPEIIVKHNVVTLDQTSTCCSECSTSFGLINFRNNCTLCGNSNCSDCLKYYNLPEYPKAVPVCNDCSPDIFKTQKEAWANNLKNSSIRKKITSKYLAVMDECGFTDKATFLKLAEKFRKDSNFPLAMQCHFSGGGDWMEFALKLANRKVFNYAARCLEMVPKKTTDDWIKLGDSFAKTNSIKALLHYSKGIRNNFEKEYIKKAFEFGNHSFGVTCLRYMFSIYQNYYYQKGYLENLGEKALKEGKYLIAFYCFSQKTRSKHEWVSLINELEIGAAEVFFNGVVNLQNFNWKDTKLKADRDHFRWAALAGSDLDKWLNYLIEGSKNNKISNFIRYINQKMKDVNFIIERDKYFDKKDYNKAILCHFLANNGVSLDDLAKKMQKKDEMAALAIYSSSSEQLDLVADRLFKEKKYSLALRCWLKTENYISILQKSKEVDRTTRLLYLNNLFKIRPQDNITFLSLCRALLEDPKNKIQIKNILISRLHKESSSITLHQFLGDLDLSDNELMGLFMTVKNLSSSDWFDKSVNQRSDQSIAIQQWFSDKLKGVNERIKKGLKDAIYQTSLNDILPFFDLINPLSYASVNEVLNELQFEKYPKGPCKSLCLAIRAVSTMLGTLNPNLITVMTNLSEAMLGDPREEFIDFTTKILGIIKKRHSTINRFRGESLTKVNPSKKSEFTDRLNRNNPLLKLLVRSEKAMEKFEPVDAAMSYIDMCMAIPSAPGLAGGFLMAASELMKAMEELTKYPRLQYAYRRAVVELLVNAYSIGNAHLCPTTQLYVLRSSIAILTSAFAKFKTISEHEQLVLETFYSDMDKLSAYLPLVNGNMKQIFDLIYLDLVNRNLLETLLPKLSDSHQQTTPMYQYYIFEGTWKGWIDEEKFNFEKERQKTMKALLKDANHSINDVENLMNWPMLVRQSDGWLSNEPVPLNLEDGAFSHVEGIRFNLDTGEISFLLEGSDNPMDSLFDISDVKDIMELGVTGAHFTLDPPNTHMSNHPFQNMIYEPKCLSRTNYLATMLHTDLLLKMLSMGTEINSQSPFELRDAEEGLLDRLPEELKQKFLKLRKKVPQIAGKIHRFWIEAGDLKYYQSQSGNEITYRFGPCKMSVKKHLMRRDAEGNLVDTDKDEDKDSPEAQFAELMTNEYENLGKYFPELARLSELVKIQAMSAIAQNIHENVITQSKELNISESDIQENLNDLRNQITYPQATSSHVWTLVDKLLTKNNFNRSNIPSTQLNEIYHSIYDQCSKADKDCINQISDILSKNFHASFNDVKLAVTNWLDFDGKNKLIRLLKSAVEEYQREKILRITKTFKKMNFATKLVKTNTNGEFSWVPAAFAKLDSSKVYGGVNMNARLIPGGLGGPPNRGGPVGGGSTGTGYRHVVGVNGNGRIYGTTVCVDRVTGNTYVANKMGSSVNDQWNKQPNTVAFWKTHVGYTTTEHYTTHRWGSTHIHHIDRTGTCINPKGEMKSFNKNDGHRC